MKVLVACEESQVVCKAFRSVGIEAFSCDILIIIKYGENSESNCRLRTESGSYKCISESRD